MCEEAERKEKTRLYASDVGILCPFKFIDKLPIYTPMWYVEVWRTQICRVRYEI